MLCIPIYSYPVSQVCKGDVTCIRPNDVFGDWEINVMLSVRGSDVIHLLYTKPALLTYSEYRATAMSR